MKHPYSKVTFLGLLLHAAAFTAKAQTNGSVGIGTTAPDASAVLDLAATNKGLLVPRLDSAARVGIAQPATGLLVFQTSPRRGFYYYSGSGWLFLADKARGGDNLGNGVATTALNLQGNALVGNGATIGTRLGLGVRADGGLNIGQNTPGSSVYIGFQAGAVNTGANNFFLGYRAGAVNTIGERNLFIGYGAGGANMTATRNHFIGIQAGLNNITGERNHFDGYFTGLNNTTGNENFFSGHQAGQANTEGSNNHFSGSYSGYSTTTGSNNVFSGYQTGFNNSTGSSNTALGYQAGPTSGSLTNATALGANARVSQSNSLVLGGTETNAVRVGIGTDAPLAPLELRAGSTISATATGTETELRLTRPGASGSKWNANAELALGTYATGINSQSQLDFRLGNGGNNTADQTVLSLRGDGRVEVGREVTTPATGAANVLAAGYGNVFGAGTLSNATSNVTVRRADPGEYVLTFTGPLATADFGSTAVALTLFNGPGFVSYTSGGAVGQLLVRTYNAGGTLTDRGFSFVVFQP